MLSVVVVVVLVVVSVVQEFKRGNRDRWKVRGDLKEGEDQRAFCCGCRKVDTQIARDKRADNFHICESIQLIKPLIVIIETFVSMFSASEKER